MAYGCQRNWQLHHVEAPSYIKRKGFKYFIVELKGIQPYIDITMLFSQFREIIESEVSLVLFDNDKIVQFYNDNITTNPTRFYYIKEEVSLDSLDSLFVW